MEDSDFVNQFSLVLGVLIAIGVLIFIIANSISGAPEPGAAVVEVIKARVKPVGRVHVGDVVSIDIPAAEAGARRAGAPEEASAEQVYRQVCAVCHASGVLNAPVYGDVAAWQARLSDIEALYTSSINGKGQMPAKGGRVDLSDAAIKAAVDYMVDAVR